jgi:hypothetical protein
MLRMRVTPKHVDKAAFHDHLVTTKLIHHKENADSSVCLSDCRSSDGLTDSRYRASKQTRSSALTWHSLRLECVVQLAQCTHLYTTLRIINIIFLICFRVFSIIFVIFTACLECFINYSETLCWRSNSSNHEDQTNVLFSIILQCLFGTPRNHCPRPRHCLKRGVWFPSSMQLTY